MAKLRTNNKILRFVTKVAFWQNFLRSGLYFIRTFRTCIRIRTFRTFIFLYLGKSKLTLRYVCKAFFKDIARSFFGAFRWCGAPQLQNHRLRAIIDNDSGNQANYSAAKRHRRKTSPNTLRGNFDANLHGEVIIWTNSSKIYFAYLRTNQMKHFIASRIYAN